MMFAHRVIKNASIKIILAILACTASFLACRPNEQIGGMYILEDFSTTPVCHYQEKYIGITNNSSQETVILGANFSKGTNRYGSFQVVAVVVNNEETVLQNKRVERLVIPAHANYAFKIRYEPLLENKTDDIAYFDIAYQSPRQGVYQVRVSGSSTTRDTQCVTVETPSGPVEGLDGDLIFRITKLEAATSPLDATMSSDQGTVPFGIDASHRYIDIPIRISHAGHSVTLPSITRDRSLALPPPAASGPNKAPDDIVNTGITIPTVITTGRDISGVFNPDNGEITLPSVPIIMDGDFHTEFSLDLTTESRSQRSVRIPINITALRSLGSLWNESTQELHGQRINTSDQGSVILIGFVQIGSVTVRNPNPSLEELGGKSMAVIIYGNIIQNTN
ncbi:MAG: hypothetical protein IPJ69_11155 [Deltaproteobacteria bacterium]|nr:MAG: hypothetical protein IPJ69_11155 [Deltaproteobacteria bacterium]